MTKKKKSSDTHKIFVFNILNAIKKNLTNLKNHLI